MIIPPTNSSAAAVIAGSASANSASADHQFSRLNVIGTFLALQLCQLTQPYGSLLFRKYRGAFWRCNPLASFAEACVIFWHLGVVVARSRKQSWSEILKNLQAASAALLLVRGLMDKDDISDLTREPLLVNSSGTQRVTDPLQNSSTSTITPDRTSLDITSPEPSLPIPDTNAADAADSALSSSQTLAFQQAFDTNVIGHKALLIDIFTAFTEFVMFLKLVSIHGAPWFTAGGLFLIFGWSSIQILLILLHYREMSSAEIAGFLSTAKILNVQLRGQKKIWLALFILLHLPFLGYPAYLSAFLSWSPEVTTGSRHWINKYVYAVIGQFGGYFVTPILMSLHRSPLKHIYTTCQISAIFLAVAIWSLWFGAAAASWEKQDCIEHVRAGHYGVERCSGDSEFYFELDTLLHYAVDRSFYPWCGIVWMTIILTPITVVYSVITMPEEFERLFKIKFRVVKSATISSLGNAIFVLVVFVLYLLRYDASNTYKPDWVDVLG